MKHPGFSVSTALFVVILLGGLAFVGAMVNPIKTAAQEAGHDHETETKQTTASNTTALPKIGSDLMAKADSPERQKAEAIERKQRETMLKTRAAITQIGAAAKHEMGEKPVVPTALKDPEAIDPTSSHFFKDDMGAPGIEKQRINIAAQKKAFEAAMEKQRKNPLGKTTPIKTDAPKASQQGGEQSQSGQAP